VKFAQRFRCLLPPRENLLPEIASRARTPGSAKASATAAFNVLTISLGVPLGAQIACQDVT
jgi:hypothetical protein